MVVRQKGFTLVELMTVATVIGALAAISIPFYQDYVTRAQAANGLASIRPILTTITENELRGKLSFNLTADTGLQPGASPLGTIYYQYSNPIASPGSQSWVSIQFNESTRLNGSSLWYFRNGGDTAWHCTYNFPAQYGPKNCPS